MSFSNVAEGTQITAADAELRASFICASIQEQIKAAANQTADDDLRYNEETIARYILDLKSTPDTAIFQECVKTQLAWSQLSADELDAHELNRATITDALAQANKNFLVAQAMERRAALARSPA